MGRNRRFGSIAALAVAGLIVGIGLVGEAEALSPIPAPKAEIIYSNGGRIIQVAADGSDREVLTRPGRIRVPGSMGKIGDRFPRVSPDGTKVLFMRHDSELAPENEWFLSGQNMLLDRNSGRVSEVLPRTRRVSYEDLAWIPGTKRVLASKSVSGKVSRRSVVSIRLDGSGERTVLAFNPYRGGMPKQNLEAGRLAVSPDGKSFLMTAMDYWSTNGYRLELVDLASGKRKLVAKGGAHSGAWAPDGSGFVFVRDRKKTEVCDWFFDCVPSGDLFTAAADGSGIRQLTDTRRDEANPSFSPDGRQIVFSGAVNWPADRSTSELFSMDARGGCANWLTNGSPASLDPEFVPGPGEAMPLGCDPVARPALAEGRLNPVWKKGFGKRLWLGPSSGQGMLSMDADIVFLTFAVYNDCPFFKAADCPPGTTVGTSPVCFDQGGWADIAAQLVRSKRKLKRRGVWVTQSRRRGELETTVYSGRRTTTIGGALSPRANKPRKLGAQAQLALVDELRLEGQSRTARLPKLEIPRFDFRLARLVKRLVRKTSIAAVMKDNKVKRRWVVNQLNFERNIKRLGPVGRTACPDTSDPWDMD